jgi:transcription antitermination factor NusG
MSLATRELPRVPHKGSILTLREISRRDIRPNGIVGSGNSAARIAPTASSGTNSNQIATSRASGRASAVGDWLVAISSRTKLACSNAKDAGFTAYAPVYREKVGGKWKDRFLLGRYFLVEIIQDWATQYYSLLKIVGIKSVLHYDETMPVIVRNADVRRLRLRENKYHQIELPIERFKLKQRVMITKGPFANKFGAYAGEQDVLNKVELDAFGVAVVPINCLIAV